MWYYRFLHAARQLPCDIWIISGKVTLEIDPAYLCVLSHISQRGCPIKHHLVSRQSTSTEHFVNLGQATSCLYFSLPLDVSLEGHFLLTFANRTTVGYTVRPKLIPLLPSLVWLNSLKSVHTVTTRCHKRSLKTNERIDLDRAGQNPGWGGHLLISQEWVLYTTGRLPYCWSEGSLSRKL